MSITEPCSPVDLRAVATVLPDAVRYCVDRATGIHLDVLRAVANMATVLQPGEREVLIAELDSGMHSAMSRRSALGAQDPEDWRQVIVKLREGLGADAGAGSLRPDERPWFLVCLSALREHFASEDTRVSDADLVAAIVALDGGFTPNDRVVMMREVHEEVRRAPALRQCPGRDVGPWRDLFGVLASRPLADEYRAAIGVPLALPGASSGD